MISVYIKSFHANSIFGGNGRPYITISTYNISWIEDAIVPPVVRVLIVWKSTKLFTIFSIHFGMEFYNRYIVREKYKIGAFMGVIKRFSPIFHSPGAFSVRYAIFRQRNISVAHATPYWILLRGSLGSITQPARGMNVHWATSRSNFKVV